MSIRKRVGLIALIFPLLFLLLQTTLARGSIETAKHSSEVTLTLVGRVVNIQGTALDGAEVHVSIAGVPQTLLIPGEKTEAAYTSEDGFYVVELVLPRSLLESETLTVEVSKSSFRTTRWGFTCQEMACTDAHLLIRAPDIVLPHVFNAAFFTATITFVAVFVLIAFHVLHDTVAAFLGATVMLGVSYTVGTFEPGFWILGFKQAVEFIDFDVIFLIMTLMIVMSIIGRTGVFQWLALTAYRVARGHAWRLAVILMVSTAVLSAFLNNVTIMLLMAPITIQIALMLGINPAALIIPEVLASNIGGIATLIGDPPNTVIGSFADLGFNQFLVHMGPIALIAILVLIAVVYVIYRRDYAAARKVPSPTLLARLEKDAQITDPVTLKRGLLVVGVMMALFFTSELFQMPPSVVGLIGATTLLVWVRPDVEQMLSEVDWTTLMFFMSLFIMVGGVQEVGLIRWIADLIADAAGANLSVASQAILWLSVVASAIVNNIPFTTAVLPIAAFLTRTIPGTGNNVLYWSLSLGANLGGNATYIGSAPNVVAVGVLDRAGYRVTFVDWLKVGIPVTFATVLVPTIWLWIRYFWLKF
jgi:Na+/H+ antiporter NhaD/arsenite permease-like protein